MNGQCLWCHAKCLWPLCHYLQIWHCHWRTRGRLYVGIHCTVPLPAVKSCLHYSIHNDIEQQGRDHAALFNASLNWGIPLKVTFSYAYTVVARIWFLEICAQISVLSIKSTNIHCWRLLKSQWIQWLFICHLSYQILFFSWIARWWTSNQSILGLGESGPAACQLSALAVSRNVVGGFPWRIFQWLINGLCPSNIFIGGCCYFST